MKTLQLFIGLAGVLVTANAEQPNPSGATPVPPRTPTRLLFNAYEGDPGNVTPQKMWFQIDTLDLRQPAFFKHR